MFGIEIDFGILQEAVTQQIIVLCILAGGLILFVKNRWRYDVVALLILIGVVAAGSLSYTEALANFGHPAVIIVASMFVMSRALVESGMIDATLGRMTFLYRRPILALGVLVVVVAALSGFVNNVGALAMVMPIAIHIARKSETSVALFLLPLAFASHLGGFMTLIGTPRNLLISDFREQATGVGFGIFDFFPVGSVLATIGVLFLIFVAWRLIPSRSTAAANDVPSRIYTTEVVVPEKTKLLKMTAGELEQGIQNEFSFTRVLRDGAELPVDERTTFAPGDHIIIQASVSTLTQFVEKYQLGLSGLRSQEWHVTTADDHTTVEAIVPPYSSVIGRFWYSFPLRNRFGTNFIALSRRDHAPAVALEDIALQPGDVLLLRGRLESVRDTMATLGLLAIDTMNDEEIALGRPRQIIATGSIVLGAIVMASFNVLPLAFVFLIAATALVVFDQVSLRQAYESVQPSVLVMLAGMLSLGAALQQSGAADSLAHFLLSLDSVLGPVAMLTIVLLASMFLSDFMNATASVAVMGPTAILLATSLGASIDPFLMAVAVGASCAFLTPVGHESNAIVMQKGGYQFKDYIRIGLPLEILIAIVTIPAIVYFWPLFG